MFIFTFVFKTRRSQISYQSPYSQQSCPSVKVSPCLQKKNEINVLFCIVQCQMTKKLMKNFTDDDQAYLIPRGGP